MTRKMMQRAMGRQLARILHRRNLAMLVLIFLIVGLLCFMLSAAGYPEGHAPRLLPIGLAFWILAVIIQHGDR